MKFIFCQMDVAINSIQEGREIDDNGIKTTLLPMWGKRNSRRPVEQLLGKYLTMRFYPAWNLHQSKQQRKYGAVYFQWMRPVEDSDIFEGQTTHKSRGVDKIKCYVTHAHVLNNIRRHLPNPNESFEFTTVFSAKRMIKESYQTLAIMHEPRRVRKYRHRCEVVWHPNDHYKALTLTQLVNLGYFVRSFILEDYGVKPIPLGLLPCSYDIQLRTIRVIWELLRFLELRNATLIHSRAMLPKKTEWFESMVALLMSGLGVTGERLYSIFHRWLDKKSEDVFDPFLIHEYFHPNKEFWQIGAELENEKDSEDNDVLLDQYMNINSKAVPKYLAKRKEFKRGPNPYTSIVGAMGKFSQINFMTYSSQIQLQEQFLKRMMNYERFLDHEMKEDMPAITNAFVDYEDSGDEPDDEDQEFLDFINSDARNDNRDSFDEFLTNGCHLIQNPDSEIENPSHTEKYPLYQSMGWWDGLKDAIKLRHQTEGKNLHPDFNLVFQRCMQTNKYTLDNIRRLAVILGVRTRRNRRSKDQVMLAIQEEYDFDLEET